MEIQEKLKDEVVINNSLDNEELEKLWDNIVNLGGEGFYDTLHKMIMFIHEFAYDEAIVKVVIARMDYMINRERVSQTETKMELKRNWENLTGKDFEGEFE